MLEVALLSLTDRATLSIMSRSLGCTAVRSPSDPSDSSDSSDEIARQAERLSKRCVLHSCNAQMRYPCSIDRMQG